MKAIYLLQQYTDFVSSVKIIMFSSASSKLLFLLTPNLITFRLRLCFKHFKTSSVNRHLQHKHTFN